MNFTFQLFLTLDQIKYFKVQKKPTRISLKNYMLHDTVLTECENIRLNIGKSFKVTLKYHEYS